MTIVAASLAGCAVALVVARATGVLPRTFGHPRRARSREHPTTVALRQAGLTVSVLRFQLLAAGCGVAAFAVVHALSGVATVAVVPAGFAALGPRWWIVRRSARRHEAVQKAWPDAIRDVVASIGAGVSLHRALEQLATNGPEPLRPVFSRFVVAARALGVAAALEGVRDELADATSDRVVEVLLVAHERGGAIVPDILRELAAATTRDIWVLEEIQTQSLEQRINARAVFVLPWLVLVAITLQEGPFRDFYRSAAGLAVIAVGGLASVFGMYVVRRLGVQPTEPRVLGRSR